MKFLISAVVAALLSVSTAHASVGFASWSKMGRVTASGERFRPMGFTCAHRSLRFGTLLKVTNLKNGRSVTVRVNDRGPFVRGRVMDLSMGAARAIGVSGVSKISYVVMN